MPSGNRPAPADKTAQKQQIGRPFKPGQSGNPDGRPKGSRNKFSEQLVEQFAAHFNEHGEDAIKQVYSDSPREYLRIAASLVPKQMEIEDKRPTRRAEDLTDDELAAIATSGNGASPQGPIHAREAMLSVPKARRD